MQKRMPCTSKSNKIKKHNNFHMPIKELYDLKRANNSEIVFHQILKELCKKYNKIYPDELQQKLHGATRRKVCETLIMELNLSATIPELEEQLDKMSATRMPRAPLQRGVLRLVDHLISHKIPIAIATNCTRQELDYFVKARPIFFSKFNHLVTADDVDENRSKPYPDLYLLTAYMFTEKPKPKSCLVFEDTGTGLRAALAAGMQVILTPHNTVKRKEAKQATQVLESLMDFKPEHFGLPSFSVPGYSRHTICIYRYPTYWTSHNHHETVHNIKTNRNSGACF